MRAIHKPLSSRWRRGEGRVEGLAQAGGDDRAGAGASADGVGPDAGRIIRGAAEHHGADPSAVGAKASCQAQGPQHGAKFEQADGHQSFAAGMAFMRRRPLTIGANVG